MEKSISKNPAKHLKMIISRLKNDASDAAFQELTTELDRLENLWKSDKALCTYTKLIKTLGRYLNSRKSEAHPETFSFIESFYSHLERLADPDSPGMSSTRRHAIAVKGVEQFNAFKKKIAGHGLKDRKTVTSVGQTSTHSEVDLSILKATVLSIDWEVTDAAIQKLDMEIEKLKTNWKERSVYHAYLNIIQTLGGYIGTRKAAAHRASFTLLHQVFNEFEKIVQRPDIPIKEKKATLQKTMEEFNHLKKEISEPTPRIISNDEDDDTLELMMEESAGPLQEAPVSSNPMDELISTKSKTPSAADALYDDIHLLNIFDDDKPGSNQAGNSRGLADESEHPSEEIKNFTPAINDSTPIAEIEERLSAFFDSSDEHSELPLVEDETGFTPYPGMDLTDPDKPKTPASESEDTARLEAPDIHGVALPSDPDEIVPFEFDEELFEQQPPSKTNSNIPAQDDKGMTCLPRLQNGINALENNKIQEGKTIITTALQEINAVFEDKQERVLYTRLIQSILSRVEPEDVKPGVELIETVTFIHKSLKTILEAKTLDLERSNDLMIRSVSRYIDLEDTLFQMKKADIQSGDTTLESKKPTFWNGIKSIFKPGKKSSGETS